MKHQPIGTRPRTREPGYRAEQVAAFIIRHFAAAGQAPTYAQICTGVGIKTEGEVSRIITSLERRGIVRRVGSGNAKRIGL